MSITALAALLNKKPASTPQPSAASATPKPASATVATPAAASVAAPTPPPTPVPAPAAAPSPVAPGPNAASVSTPAGLPPDTLAALLGDFTAAAGTAPRVNPPQAAQVLAGPTALEVAGHPEPPPVVEEKVAPVAKPQAVLDAENAPKTRRTAAVVQVELDAALVRIAELEEQLESGDPNMPAPDPVGADNIVAEAVAMIEQLRSEAAVSVEDNRKAWARVAELEEQLEGVAEGEHAPSAYVMRSVPELCELLAELGFEPTLRFVGAS